MDPVSCRTSECIPLEQYQEPRGRDRSEGIGVQLIPEEVLEDIVENGEIDPARASRAGTGPGSASAGTPETEEREIQETSEAEDNRSPAFFIPPPCNELSLQMPDLLVPAGCHTSSPITVFPSYPTASQQRRQIEQRMDAVFAGESSIPSEVIDEFLRTGGGRSGSQLRIIYNFMTDPSPEEAADFVQVAQGRCAARHRQHAGTQHPSGCLYQQYSGDKVRSPTGLWCKRKAYRSPKPKIPDHTRAGLLTALWCNGNTPDSDSGITGSNPVRAALGH